VARHSFIQNTAANRSRIPVDLRLVLPHRYCPKQSFGIRYVLRERKKGENLRRVATLSDVQARCEFLTAVPLNIQVWWEVPPRGIINSYRCFARWQLFHLQGQHSRKSSLKCIVSCMSLQYRVTHEHANVVFKSP